MKPNKVKWSGRLKRETVKLIKTTAKTQKISEADVVDAWATKPATVPPFVSPFHARY